MIGLIIYLVGVIVSISLAYYFIHISATRGNYFTVSDLLMVTILGIASWIGVLMIVISLLLEIKDWKLWKIK